MGIGIIVFALVGVFMLVRQYREFKEDCIKFVGIVLGFVLRAVMPTIVLCFFIRLEWDLASPEERMEMMPGKSHDLMLQFVVWGAFALEATRVLLGNWQKSSCSYFQREFVMSRIETKAYLDVLGQKKGEGTCTS